MAAVQALMQLVEQTSASRTELMVVDLPDPVAPEEEPQRSMIVS